MVPADISLHYSHHAVIMWHPESDQRWVFLSPFYTSSPCNEFVLNDVIKLALRVGEGHENTATHLHVSDLQHEESKAVEVSVWDD